MHDTEVDGIHGEYLRETYFYGCVDALSNKIGIPVDEIKLGLKPAIHEFLEENKNWVVHAYFTNNNGLTILKRVS